MHTNPIGIILWQALATFLLIGALAGAALALLLIFKPHLLGRINRATSRWVSTRHIDRLLDKIISLEEWFYRYHRPLGILIILGAGYISVFFGLLFDRTASLQRLAGYMPARLADGLLDALVLSMLTGAVIALLAGLFLWLRPSLLRGIEEKTNKWVSSRRATKVLAVPRDNVDSYVAQHAQSIGWLLLLGSIYLFFVLFRLLA